MDAKTVRDVDVTGRRVFVRADLNVPIEDGRITDDTRIRASLPTIVHLLERGATVILASHLGRPKGKVNDALRLKPVADRLSQLLGRPVRMTGDALGPGVQVAVDKLRPGDLLLLENLRFHAAEEANDPEFAASLAGLADLYVNDAFGAAHRAHASTEGITHHLPAVAGLLMEREVDALSRLLVRPGASVPRGARRREGLRQAGGHRGARLPLPGRAARRRDGEHLPRGARPRARQEPRRAGPAREREAHLRRGAPQARPPHAADRCRRRAADPPPGADAGRPGRRRAEGPDDRRHRSRYAEGIRGAPRQGEDDLLERTDGCLRGAAVRRGHEGDRQGAREAPVRRRSSPSSAAAIRWPRSSSSAWRRR